MRLMLALVASLMLVAGCGGAATTPTPEPTITGRAQASEPLREDEVTRCMMAESTMLFAQIDSASPRRTLDPQQLDMLKVISERGDEYSRELYGDDYEAALMTMAPVERMEPLARIAQRLGADADIAMMCRVSILPELDKVAP